MPILVLDQMSPTATNLSMFAFDTAGEVTRDLGAIPAERDPSVFRVGFAELSFDYLFPRIARDARVEIFGTPFRVVLNGEDITTSGGIVTGGVLRTLFAEETLGSPTEFLIGDVRIDAGRLADVLASDTRADDFRLLSGLLGGDDVIFTNNNRIGSDGRDAIGAGGGDDMVVTDRGDDRIWGGTGRDFLAGEDGGDVLYGGAGNDALFGGAGRDVLRGDGGQDLLAGGTGVDVLFGGQGADWFVMEANGERDVVRDFQDGVDRIVIAERIGLEDVRFRQLDPDRALVAWDGGGVVLRGMTVDRLSVADLLVGARGPATAAAQAERILSFNDNIGV